jgi:hypothetical protein
MEKFHVILTAIFLFYNSCDCYKYKEAKILREYLFDATRYDESIRPVIDSSTVTKVLNVLIIVCTLCNQNKGDVFHWRPGHCGTPFIEGN